MKFYLKILFFFLFQALIFKESVSQTSYPVSSNIQLIPPYSPYLSDYTAVGTEKLFVNLLLNDQNEPFYFVKLKITIEGVGIKIETHPDFRPDPIRLEKGFTERLGSAELAQYFDSRNLVFSGITQQQYQKNARLPDGLYKFCIQAYDADRNTQIPLSNKGCATAWVQLNDPPFLLCQERISVISPQNIFFQWQARQASPNESTVEYHFRLVPIIPSGRNPNDAMNSSFPIYEIITNNTSLHYSLTEPTLIPGQEYAWRVQAKDINGKDLFKNNGYSQVCMFTYGEPCTAPINQVADVQNSQRVKISWDEVSSAKKYFVRYRIKGFDSSSDWYQVEAYTNSVTLTGLKPDRKYEYQLQSYCNELGSEFSQIDTFSTKPNYNNKDCGKPFVKAIPDASTILATLNPNDVLISDGFKIRIIEANGGNGVFSGKGIAYVPFVNNYLKMNFTNINVNSKYEVYNGKIIAERSSLAKFAKTSQGRIPNDICQTTSLEEPNIAVTKDQKKEKETGKHNNSSTTTSNEERAKPENANSPTATNPKNDPSVQKNIDTSKPIGDKGNKSNTNSPDNTSPAPVNPKPIPIEVNKIASIIAYDLKSDGKRKAKEDEILYIVGKMQDKRKVKFVLENTLKDKSFSSQEVEWTTDYNIEDKKPEYKHGKFGKELILDYDVYWPEAKDGIKKTLTKASCNETFKGVNIILVKEDILKMESPIASYKDGKFSSPVSKTTEKLVKTREKLNQILDYIKVGEQDIKKPKKKIEEKFEVKIKNDYKNVEEKNSPLYYREKKVTEEVSISKGLEVTGPGMEWPPKIGITYLESFIKIKAAITANLINYYRKDIGKQSYTDATPGLSVSATVSGEIVGGIRGGADIMIARVEFRGEGSGKLGGSYTYFPSNPEGSKNELIMVLLDDVKIRMVAEGSFDIGVYKLSGEEVLAEWIAISKEDNIIRPYQY